MPGKFSSPATIATLLVMMLSLSVAAYFAITLLSSPPDLPLDKPKVRPVHHTAESELVKRLPCVLLSPSEGQESNRNASYLIVEPQDLLVYEALARNISSVCGCGPGNQFCLSIRGYAPCDELIRRLSRNSQDIWGPYKAKSGFEHWTNLKFGEVNWVTPKEANVDVEEDAFTTKYRVTLRDGKYFIAAY